MLWEITDGNTASAIQYSNKTKQLMSHLLLFWLWRESITSLFLLRLCIAL